MEKKAYLLALVVIVGILVGVSIVVNQTKEPLLREILTKQELILDRLSSGSGSSSGGGNTAALDQRIADLENKLKLAQNQPAAAPRQAPPQPDLTKVHEIPVDDTPLIGDKNAEVTITEFVDFECPFCARFHPAINEVMAEYPGKVNVLVKNFPLSFHPNAKPASKAALAAGEQGKYQEMVDLLLLNGRNLNEETFKKLAGDVGVNVDRFMKDYKENDAKYERIINNDMALGGKVGVRGTPSFYINGRITYARDLATWKTEVEKELNK